MDLQQAIAEYLEAEKQLLSASTVLSACIQDKMQSIMDDEEALSDLVDILPQRWFGCRRIYEQIMRLSDNENQSK